MSQSVAMTTPSAIRPIMGGFAVVGARNTYVDCIPAAGDSNFMLESWSEKKPDVASTEVYYDGFLPPSG